MFKKNKLGFKFKSYKLYLSLGSGWERYEFEDPRDEDPLSFVKSQDGVGILQISSLKIDADTKFDINKHLKNNNQEYIKDIEEYNLNDWRVYEYSDVKDNNFIKYFQLIQINVLVMATYICREKLVNQDELDEAIAIIRTIEIEK